MTSTYHDRWLDEADTPLTVYVPTIGALTYIRPGSGIVGRPFLGEPAARVEICYEGNLYDIENLKMYRDRVSRASDRLITRYPTVARAVVDPATLIAIGFYMPRTQTLTVTDLEALATWI